MVVADGERQLTQLHPPHSRRVATLEQQGVCQSVDHLLGGAGEGQQRGVVVFWVDGKSIYMLSEECLNSSFTRVVSVFVVFITPLKWVQKYNT